MRRAGLLSLAIHGLLIAGLMALVTRAPATRMPPLAVPVELLEQTIGSSGGRPRENPARPTAPARLPTSAHVAILPRPELEVVLRPRGTMAPQSDQPTVPVSSPAPAGGAGNALLGMRGPQQPDLFDADAITAAASQPAASATANPLADRVPASPGATVHAIVEGAEGGYRVEAGSANPYYFDVGRRALEFFHPSSALLATIAALPPDNRFVSKDIVDPTVGATRRYDHAIPLATDAYNRWSAAVAQLGTIQGRLQDADGVAAALVAAHLSADGRVEKVELRQSSGARELDALAVAAVVQALDAVPRSAAVGNRPVVVEWLCSVPLGGRGAPRITLVSLVDE